MVRKLAYLSSLWVECEPLVPKYLRGLGQAEASTLCDSRPNAPPPPRLRDVTAAGIGDRMAMEGSANDRRHDAKESCFPCGSDAALGSYPPDPEVRQKPGSSRQSGGDFRTVSTNMRQRGDDVEHIHARSDMGPGIWGGGTGSSVFRHLLEEARCAKVREMTRDMH